MPCRKVCTVLVLQINRSEWSVLYLPPCCQPSAIQRSKFLNLNNHNEYSSDPLLMHPHAQCVSFQNCMYDSCNCEKSEDCMCAAVSAYVYACSAAGIHLSGWRSTICSE